MPEAASETFYREVHVDDARLAARRFAATNLRHLCPACGRGKVTRGAIAVAEVCSVCGSRFDRIEGNALVAVPISFFPTIATLLALSLVVIPRYGFFDGLMFALFGVGVVVVLLMVRPARVLTLWLLWLLGFVYPDRVPEKGRWVLPRRRHERA
jgi:uncharacterized protein (DUF983 family)